MLLSIPHHIEKSLASKAQVKIARKGHETTEIRSGYRSRIAVSVVPSKAEHALTQEGLH